MSIRSLISHNLPDEGVDSVESDVLYMDVDDVYMGDDEGAYVDGLEDEDISITTRINITRNVHKVLLNFKLNNFLSQIK